MFRSIFILSFFLFGCSNFKHNNQFKKQSENNFKADTIFKFDPQIDYPIDIYDPRIKSIIYIIVKNPNHQLTIKHCNKRTKFMAISYKNFLNKYTKDKSLNIAKYTDITCNHLLISITNK